MNDSEIITAAIRKFESTLNDSKIGISGLGLIIQRVPESTVYSTLQFSQQATENELNNAVLDLGLALASVLTASYPRELAKSLLDVASKIIDDRADAFAD